MVDDLNTLGTLAVGNNEQKECLKKNNNNKSLPSSIKDSSCNERTHFCPRQIPFQERERVARANRNEKIVCEGDRFENLKTGVLIDMGYITGHIQLYIHRMEKEKFLLVFIYIHQEYLDIPDIHVCLVGFSHWKMMSWQIKLSVGTATTSSFFHHLLVRCQFLVE